jgi:uncharacterized protein YlxP (DUF503 family)
MTIGILTVNYHLPYSRDLKEKRQIIQSIKKTLQNQFNISISEIDHLDLWQKSMLGISTISNSKKMADRIFNKIIDKFEHFNNGYILDYNTEYINA